MISEDCEKIKYGICRYNNIGDITCYINSILHILQQIPIFADFIYTCSYSDILKYKSKGDDNYIKNDCVKFIINGEILILDGGVHITSNSSI